MRFGLNYGDICRPGSGWAAFFASIFVWGVGMGCFQAAFNNYLVDIHAVDGVDRGVLEFLRETPGVCLIAILAVLHRYSDWKILRIGTLVSMLAAGLLLASGLVLPPAPPWALCVGLITLWALGEHLVMPVRQSLALSIAREGRGGESLGIVTSAINAGTVAGSLIVAAVFFFGLPFVSDGTAAPVGRQWGPLYDVVWILVILLLGASVLMGLRGREPGVQGRARPSFYFRRKYAKFYALELFYGARKQVFFTFGPFVLITCYGMDTKGVALLFAVSAFLTALWGGRLIGRIVDRWGYRNVMIWDTVVLFFVCLLYGFAKDVFPEKVALAVVCVNYVVDAILSNASIATNLYARTLSDSQEELTATLSSGISVNHVITVFYALFGGWILKTYGPGVLFATAAAMSLANSAFALTVPKPPVR